MRVRVFLKDPLFVISEKAAHLPPAALILEGTLQLTDKSGASSSGSVAGGIHLQVDSWFDRKGQPLLGELRTLILPAGKVDHMLVLE